MLCHCVTLLLSYNNGRNSGGVVVKLLACLARGLGFDSRSLRHTISEIGFLLLPSRDMAEISLYKATYILKTANYNDGKLSFYGQCGHTFEPNANLHVGIFTLLK